MDAPDWSRIPAPTDDGGARHPINSRVPSVPLAATDGSAVAEWAVRLGRPRGRLRFVLPVATLAGGLLLLSHTHAIANPREALLMELSHLPLAVLAAVGGGARWTGLRGPPKLARPAAAVWPARLILIGVLPLVHRDA